jgi:hypothetical protein
MLSAPLYDQYTLTEEKQTPPLRFFDPLLSPSSNISPINPVP